MREMIAVFRSRTQAIECRATLCGAGVPAAIIATPSQLKLGCGYSVKFPEGAMPAVRHIIARGNFSAFYGIMPLRR